MGDWVNLPRVLHLLVPGVAPTARGRFALARYVDPPTPSGALPPTAMMYPPEAGLYPPGTSIWPVVCAGLPLARPVGCPWGSPVSPGPVGALPGGAWGVGGGLPRSATWPPTPCRHGSLPLLFCLSHGVGGWPRLPLVLARWGVEGGHVRLP